MDGIQFTRNPEGGFTKVDNWPVGRKLAQIQVDDRPPYGKKRLSEAVELIENAIASGHARANQYTILPLIAAPMPPEVKELLNHARKEKTAGVQNQCSFDGCDVTYPRNKGRYQNRFCPAHRVNRTSRESAPPAPVSAVETELD